MNVKDSNYYRLFRYTMIIILLVILVTGIIIISFCSKLFENSRLNGLKDVGNFYISAISSEYISDNENYIDYSNNLRQKLMDNHNLRICMYDVNGKCIVSDCPENTPLDESMNFVRPRYRTVNRICFSADNSTCKITAFIFLCTAIRII